MCFRLRMQLAEALGHVNRWYCSQSHGRMIDDQELLMCHFIRSGGAADFARRFNEAMGPVNRWYCSEFHRQNVQDEETLWTYFMKFGGKSDKAA